MCRRRQNDDDDANNHGREWNQNKNREKSNKQNF